MTFLCVKYVSLPQNSPNTQFLRNLMQNSKFSTFSTFRRTVVKVSIEQNPNPITQPPNTNNYFRTNIFKILNCFAEISCIGQSCPKKLIFLFLAHSDFFLHRKCEKHANNSNLDQVTAVIKI